MRIFSSRCANGNLRREARRLYVPAYPKPDALTHKLLQKHRSKAFLLMVMQELATADLLVLSYC